MSNFDRAIKHILKHEGGYVNNPSDPGGETNYGICKRVYPNLDIKHLTLEEAIAIYRRDYWRFYYDRLPYPVAAKVFDQAVNMGHKQAHKILQRALGVVDDSIIGEATIAAANSQPVEQILKGMISEQLHVYERIIEKRPSSSVFMKGWSKRAGWVPESEEP